MTTIKPRYTIVNDPDTELVHVAILDTLTMTLLGGSFHRGDRPEAESAAAAFESEHEESLAEPPGYDAPPSRTYETTDAHGMAARLAAAFTILDGHDEHQQWDADTTDALVHALGWSFGRRLVLGQPVDDGYVRPTIAADADSDRLVVYRDVSDGPDGVAFAVVDTAAGVVVGGAFTTAADALAAAIVEHDARVSLAAALDPGGARESSAIPLHGTCKDCGGALDANRSCLVRTCDGYACHEGPDVCETCDGKACEAPGWLADARFRSAAPLRWMFTLLAFTDMPMSIDADVILVDANLDCEERVRISVDEEYVKGKPSPLFMCAYEAGEDEDPFVMRDAMTWEEVLVFVAASLMCGTRAPNPDDDEMLAAEELVRKHGGAKRGADLARVAKAAVK